MKGKKGKNCVILFLCMCMCLLLTLNACGVKDRNSFETEIHEKDEQGQEQETDFSSLVCTGTTALKYADQFSIEEYGIYKLITIADSGRFLLVPEDAAVPAGLPEDTVILQQPLDCAYLVSTSAMDLIQTIDALTAVRLSGTKKENWYVEEAAAAMQSGALLYAGKYNTPDYELILNEGCDLAIENTMIYHNPEVKEKLEALGIPVLVERSSYEHHPLGRLEWIKLFGVLFLQEENADRFFEEQLAKIEPLMEQEDTDKSVAFFYITSNGAVSVRKPKDYIAQMIELSGGRYVLDMIPNESGNALSAMNMQMEDFYAAARDADILIYNSTIDGELKGMQELIEKDALFADFKAFQEKQVYCTTGNFFQKTTGIGEFMVDLNRIYSDSDTSENTFLRKLR